MLKICRSEDGGKSWTAPAPIPSSASRSARGVYPGSLSVLSCGRIVLQFAPYYELGEHQHGDPAQLTVSAGIGAGEVYRVPEYCCSDDGTRPDLGLRGHHRYEYPSAWQSSAHNVARPSSGAAAAAAFADGHSFGEVHQIPHHNLTNYSELRFPLVGTTACVSLLLAAAPWLLLCVSHASPANRRGAHAVI